MVPFFGACGAALLLHVRAEPCVQADLPLQVISNT